MSDKQSMSLLALPMELLHCILDHIDVQTILLSVSSVCTHLRRVTHTYERYVLDLRSISKPGFHRLCNVIRPKNVISLILSDGEETSGQIKLFLAIFDIHQFTRLRSLSLFLIDDEHLDTFLNHAMKCSLMSLSIKRSRSPTYTNTTLNLLSLIMTQHTLRKLTCTIDLLSTDRFKWPLKCTVTHLTIDYCTRKQFCIILQKLSNLRTIVMHSFNLDIDDECDYLSTTYPQLTSLTMKRLFLSMDKIESLLSLTPSLTHLRLEGSADDAVFDSSRWEKFIRTKLPTLNRFEFCFRSQNYRIIELNTVEFRTPFWLEEKCWSVNFIYDTSMEELLVCLKPDILDELEYQFVGPIIISTTIQNSATFMFHNESCKPAFFRRIAQLEVSEYTLDSCNYISTLVDLSKITKLTIQLSYAAEFISRTREKLIDLLKRTNNLRSLEIFFENGLTNDSSWIESICSIVPDHVRHLDIETKMLNHINLVLEQLQHLSSATFRKLSPAFLSTEKLTEWRTQLKRDITCRSEQGSLYMWLGKPFGEDKITNATDEL